MTTLTAGAGASAGAPIANTAEIMPGEFGVVAKDVRLRTHLTREFTLNIPLMSAAMDRVTESN